jgi:pilus assembly protein CpaC
MVAKRFARFAAKLTGWLIILVALELAAGTAVAQQSDRPAESLPAPTTINDRPQGTMIGFAPALPGIPEKAPRPASEIASFIDSVPADAGFTVPLGEGKLLVVKEDLAVAGRPRPLIVVGDPTVIDFVVVGPRQLRVLGLRLGNTDLAITTADNRTFTFEIQVVADLRILRAQLKSMFPDATLKLAQLRDHVVVEGEARDIAQVARILETIKAYLVSIQAAELKKVSGQSLGFAGAGPPPRRGPAAAAPAAPDQGAPVSPGEPGPRPPGAEAFGEQAQYNVEGTVPEPHIINLIRVPGSQQVLLKVRVAELNRTALRTIGGEILGVDPATGAILGTQIGGAGVSGTGTFTPNLAASAIGTTAGSTTIFGILQSAHVEFLINALRSNAVMKILAEPNLVTLSGHPADFLAGGEFPVPVPQAGGTGGAPVVTVQFKEFGVRLGFVPYVLDDGVIRLTVDPEVSSLNFTAGAVLVPGGTPVPGLDTRKSHTTVELRQGQTLAIAGIMQLTMDGSTKRIPILGDIPIIGPFFSNDSNSRTEKELVVLVTPYLVEPMDHCQVPPSPGEEIKEPTDCEAYLLGRIEGRTPRDWRSTIHDQQPIKSLCITDKEHVRGPCGYSDH